MDGKPPTDECITQQQVQRIHDSVARDGLKQAVNALAERETALTAYVLASAVGIAMAAENAGAPRSFVNWIAEELIGRMLVCVEAQHRALYELWRDFMGDDPDPE